MACEARGELDRVFTATGLHEEAEIGEYRGVAQGNPPHGSGSPESGGLEEFQVVHALRDAIPTMRHAEMLFDMVVGELGEEALIASANAGVVRWLYRRVGPRSDVVIPWPLLTLSLQPAVVVPLDLGLPPAELPPPREEVAPRLRGLKPGYVVLHDGAVSLTVAYRDDGLWKEMSRGGPRETLAGLLIALAAKNARPAELVAESMVRLDIGRNGPGRLHMPVALPGGPQGAWQRGLFALRDALYAGRVPSAPGWIVTDGFEGKALGAGETEEAAISEWRKQIERRQPRPPIARPPTDLPEPEEPWAEPNRELEDLLRKSAWKNDVEWPEATPASTPAAVIRLDPCPLREHPWGRWLRTLGPCGESIFALQRFDPDGFTLVGQDALPLVDLDRLDEALDAIDAEMPPLPHQEGEEWRGEESPYDCRTTFYRVIHDQTRQPVPMSFARGAHGTGFSARELLDGAWVRTHVLRQRWAR